MKKNATLTTFGANIRQLRLKKDLSQTALAKKAGLSPNYIGTLERGLQNASLKTLERLAIALGCEIPHLFKGIR